MVRDGRVRFETLIPFLFPVFWVVVCCLIGHISGLQSLAATYRAAQPFDCKRWTLQSGRLRWGMSYNNCMTVGASASGLHLSVLLLFRAGHPPLFIPWEELTVGNRAFPFMRSCRFEFRAVPGVSLTVGARLGEKPAGKQGRLGHLSE